ncbi:MAG: hypothetical protein IKG79_09675 [Neisseriaceae bacterium]|nr:hypothetical protein [Neisseriaceae bacterium]
MRIDEKINRKFLIYLLWLEVSKRKIAEIFFISERSIFTYLKKYPVSESELNSVQFNSDILEEIAMNCVGENNRNTLIQQSFRLPENIVNQKNNIHSVKEKAKTAVSKSSKKSDEIQNTDEIKDTEKPDTSYLRQLSNDMAKEAQKYSQDFNK